MRYLALAAALFVAACGTSSVSDRGPVPDGVQLGVNGYLWAASLDTLKFMPVATSDPMGGVIITDWYSTPQVPDERVKVNVYILDRRLRADALRVSVFREVRSGGAWAPSTVAADTPTKLENAILARARQMRLADIGDED